MRPLTDEQQKMMASVTNTKIKKISVVAPDWEFEGQNLSAKIFHRPDRCYVQLFPQEGTGIPGVKRLEAMIKPLQLVYEVIPEIPAIASDFPKMSDEDLNEALQSMDEELELKSGS